MGQGCRQGVSSILSDSGGSGGNRRLSRAGATLSHDCHKRRPDTPLSPLWITYPSLWILKKVLWITCGYLWKCSTWNILSTGLSTGMFHVEQFGGLLIHSPVHNLWIRPRYPQPTCGQPVDKYGGGYGGPVDNPPMVKWGRTYVRGVGPTTHPPSHHQIALFQNRTRLTNGPPK